jgi:hypothetical protein
MQYNVHLVLRTEYMEILSHASSIENSAGVPPILSQGPKLQDVRRCLFVQG